MPFPIFIPNMNHHVFCSSPWKFPQISSPSSSSRVFFSLRFRWSRAGGSSPRRPDGGKARVSGVAETGATEVRIVGVSDGSWRYRWMVQLWPWLLVIPLSKWVITPIISGLTLLIPFITGVISHLLTGMSHQVWRWLLVINWLFQ